MSRLFKAAAVFAIWFLFKDSINTWVPNIRIPAHLIGIGLPLYLLLESFFPFIKDYFKIRMKENSTIRIFKDQIEFLARSASQKSQQPYRSPFQDSFQPSERFQEAPVEQPTSLLNSAQIEQLNELRSKMTIEGAKSFPVIRLTGSTMPNLVPGAGMFTAKINRNGELQNLVVMFATMQAVYDFERAYTSLGIPSQGFWAEGYLLPSRTGVCYSVLLVTSFRFCGRRITF